MMPNSLSRSSKFASRTLAAAIAMGIAVASAGPVSAQGLPLIRDSEIEALLNDYARPIFKAAGLGTGRVQMRIVKNDNFNAFVVDGKNVFIHTGALMQADTPNQVIGVIAHEAGHITGGHMAALRARIKQDQTRALLIQLLGIGAMIGGVAAGGDAGRDVGAVGQGVMGAGSEIIMRSLLSERRSQEGAADHAGLTFLNATRQSGRGMLETFERFAQQEYLSDVHKDAFARSHPVATDRLARLRQSVEQSPHYNQKDPPELQFRHDLMRAKLAGYIERPGVVMNRYPATDRSMPARYARALARFFQGGQGALEAAIAELNTLIKERPNYAYFHEVKGDLYMRAGRTKEAIPNLRQALRLAPDATLIRLQLAMALQKSETPAETAESVELLKKSLIEDKNPVAYRQLANAYYRQGKGPEADAMQAQAHFYEGNLQQAQNFAKRARTRLTRGTPVWENNEDVINFKPPQT